MDIDWALVGVAMLAALDAMLVGAVIVWTLVDWGVL